MSFQQKQRSCNLVVPKIHFLLNFRHYVYQIETLIAQECLKRKLFISYLSNNVKNRAIFIIRPITHTDYYRLLRVLFITKITKSNGKVTEITDDLKRAINSSFHSVKWSLFIFDQAKSENSAKANFCLNHLSHFLNHSIIFAKPARLEWPQQFGPRLPSALGTDDH